MGLFSNILEKLGLKKPEEVAPVPSKPVVIPSTQVGDLPKTTTGKPAIPTTRAGGLKEGPGGQFKLDAFKPAAIPVVDVVAKLEKLAATNGEKLNWKVSIVDLLKLLGIDSSLASRKELAIELGCPGDKMADSAEMNMWLHKAVLRKIAENGGNIPQSLLD